MTTNHPSTRWQPAAETAATSTRRPLVPWVLFGGALVIAVAALLGAIALWLIVSGRSDLAAVELDRALAERDRAQRELRATQADLTEAQAKLHEEMARRSATETAAGRSAQEVESLKSRLADLETARQAAANVDPRQLPLARLPDLLGSSPRLGLRVFLEPAPGPGGFDVEAVERMAENSAQALRFALVEEADSLPFLVVSVIHTPLSDGAVSLSVMATVETSWKAPQARPAGEGEAAAPERQGWVRLWARHAVGACSEADAQKVVGELVDELLRDLSRQLAPAAPGGPGQP